MSAQVLTADFKTLLAIEEIIATLDQNSERKEAKLWFANGVKIRVRGLQKYKKNHDAPYRLAKTGTKNAILFCLPFADPESYERLYDEGIKFSIANNTIDLKNKIYPHLNGKFDCNVKVMCAHMNFRNKTLHKTPGIFKVMALVDAVNYGITDIPSIGGLSLEEIKQQFHTSDVIDAKFAALIGKVDGQLDNKVDREEFEKALAEAQKELDNALAELRNKMEGDIAAVKEDVAANKKDIQTNKKDIQANKKDADAKFAAHEKSQQETAAEIAKMKQENAKKDAEMAKLRQALAASGTKIPNQEPGAARMIISHPILISYRCGMFYLGIVPWSPLSTGTRIGIKIARPLEEQPTVTVSLARKPDNLKSVELACVVCDWKVNGSVISCGNVLDMDYLRSHFCLLSSGPLPSKLFWSIKNKDENGNEVQNGRLVYSKDNVPIQNIVLRKIEKIYNGTYEKHDDQLGHGSVVRLEGSRDRYLLLGPPVSDKEI